MARKANRPVIDIQRIPTGDFLLEEVVADVFLWIFEHQSSPKSSADTFVKADTANYNDSINMISGGKNSGTAA